MATRPRANQPAKFRPLHEVVEEHIDAALKVVKGNKAEAAKLLGVGRSTLYRRRSPTATHTTAPIPRSFRGGRDGGDGRAPSALERENKSLRARVVELREITGLASNDPADDYLLGLANGLIQARHIMDGRTGTPSYL
jgi:hypothetical protein